MRAHHVTLATLALAACSNTNDGHCTKNADCPSFDCRAGACVETASCATLKAANPGAADGTYTIDPDGPGGAAPLSVWCDMTTSGGGWTALPLSFKDAALWSVSYSGDPCVDGPKPGSGGSIQSVFNGKSSAGWSFLSVKFLLPIAVKEVWLDNLNHSTSTVANNMDVTSDSTAESTQDARLESWYFAGTDPRKPLAHVFAAGCDSPGYSKDSSQPVAVCSMPRPGSDALAKIQRSVKLSSTADRFHMVVVQGCGADPPASLGQSERFYINHPSSGGTWKDGILIR